MKPVPFTAVHVNDAVWALKSEINRSVTIPFAFEQEEKTGRIDNFVRAAEALRGEPVENHRPPGYPFDDSDVYKVIEGASYTLSVHPDPRLDAYLDGLIAKIAAAQENGYFDWYPARGNKETVDYAFPARPLCPNAGSTGSMTPDRAACGYPRPGACCSATAANGSPLRPPTHMRWPRIDSMPWPLSRSPPPDCASSCWRSPTSRSACRSGP